MKESVIKTISNILYIKRPCPRFTKLALDMKIRANLGHVFFESVWGFAQNFDPKFCLNFVASWIEHENLDKNSPVCLPKFFT